MAIPLLLLSLIVPFASSLSFNYTSFGPANDGNNIIYDTAFPDANRIIQLASSSVMVGRATYSKPIPLWDKSTGTLTDFNTHFVFEIDSQNRSGYAHGLAFFLAPQGSTFPSVTRGDSFGLTSDDQTLNSTSNRFVAVEFDINQNAWDPPGDHVGIDVNSMRSVRNSTWWSDIMGGQRSEAWITYNSATHNLSVVFSGTRDNVTVMQQLDHRIDLSLHLPEFVTIGFSAATGNATTIHSLHSWEFSSSLEVNESTFINESPPPPPPPRRMKIRRGGRKITVGVGSGVGGGVVVIALVLVWYIVFGRKSNGGDEEDQNNGVNEDRNHEIERETNTNASHSNASSPTSSPSASLRHTK